MQLTINDRYRIRGDQYQWIVEERKRRCDTSSDLRGSVYTAWRSVGYFASLTHAVATLTDLQLRTSGARDIVQAMVESKRITSELVAALSPTFQITQSQAAE